MPHMVNGVKWLAACLVVMSSTAQAGVRPALLSAALASEDDAENRLSRTRISLRGNDLPLGTVLNQIARSAKLALVLDKDVRVDVKLPAVDLDAQPLDAALAVVLTPLGYSYEVDSARGFLRVFVYAVATFKVSMPVVVQSWQTGITNGGEAGGAQGGAGGAGSAGGLGARIALSTRSDSNGLWEEVERSMGRLLGSEQAAAPAREGQPARPELGSFSVNRVAGFVTVRALPSVMPSIESYFNALESEMGRSVVVDVRVMQVDLNDTKAAGVDWNLAAVQLGPLFLEGGTALAGTSTNNVFNGQTQGATAPFVRMSGRAGDALLKALEAQGQVKLLGQPNMALGNNLPALIELAEISTYVDQIVTTVVMGGAAQSTVRTATVSNGLIISMMPRILDKGDVSIALGLVLQEVLAINTFAFPGGAVQLPQTSRRSYSGVVRARLNETMVLGGLITSRKEKRTKGLPALSRIPILGVLFGQQEYVDRSSELIITLTPREVQTSRAEPRPLRLEPSAE
jgi:type II secretory pathway component GspD/PulD (secretin)